MKILQILPELNVGGVERGTVDLSRALVARGYESVVVSNGGTLVDQLTTEGTLHYALPVHKKNIFTMIYCIRELRKLIVAHNIDIVHARSRIPAWIAWFAVRKTDAEFLTTCHGYYARHFMSHVMGWSRLVIVISEVIGRHMIDHFGVQPQNIRLIHRSVDLSRFPFRAREPGRSSFTVVMVGRITPLKGHQDFLKAMAKVIRQRPYVRVRIIGDASAGKRAYKDSLLLLTRRLGITAQVEFMGNRSDIPRLLQEADALVLATVTQEAFGRVLIEAQAAGVPVIATKVGGVVEIVEHEKTGLLVLPGDPDGMAAAVMRLINEPRLCDLMTQAARIHVEKKYTLERMVNATLKVYNELRNSSHILVIKLSAVGDIILASASFKALREKFPQARISCLVGREGAALLQGCPYLDEIIVYDYKQKDRGLFGFWKLVRKLRHFRFDRVIDLQNNNRSHLIAFACQPRASYGYRNRKLGWLLSNGIPDDQPGLSPIRHQFRILEQTGVVYDEKKALLEFWPRKDDFEYARQLLNAEWIDENKHTVIGLNIAASERWPTKNWPMPLAAKFCDLCAAQGMRVIVTGMDKDRDLLRQLLGAVRSKPSILVGKTNILQLAALIGYCRVYVSVDSAPLHVAAAMKVPVLALFGPTDPVRHLPPGDHVSVLSKKMDCSACYKDQCLTRKNACMSGILPDQVFREVMRLAGRTQG